MLTFLAVAACSLATTPSPTLDLLGPLQAGATLPPSWTMKPVRGQRAPEYGIRADEAGARWRISGTGTAAWAVRKLNAPQCESDGVLAWSWRVLQRPDSADLRAARSDDSPIRLFVLFGKQPGPFGGGGRLLFYTWGAREPEGFSTRSFATSRAHVMRMAGDGEVGDLWREERVQPFADFRRIWGEDPPPITAIGVLQDTDATRQTSIAELRSITWTPALAVTTAEALP